jgi:hypothetical protein
MSIEFISIIVIVGFWLLGCIGTLAGSKRNYMLCCRGGAGGVGFNSLSTTPGALRLGPLSAQTLVAGLMG